MIAVFNIYTIFPAFDIPMHFLGGLSIGVSAIILLNIFKSKITTPKWFLFLWIISLTVMIAVLWEFAEFTADYFFQTQMQLSLADTMGDLLMGMLGGMTAGIWFIKKS
ncbi:MAG: hypothetical protein WCX88_03595 [Patescibacteria group bacterium]